MQPASIGGAFLGPPGQAEKQELLKIPHGPIKTTLWIILTLWIVPETFFMPCIMHPDSPQAPVRRADLGWGGRVSLLKSFLPLDDQMPTDPTWLCVLPYTHHVST